MDGRLTPADVAEALATVEDPHFRLSLGEMGMVEQVRVSGPDVWVTLRMPCLGCPAWDDIEQSVHDRLQTLPGLGATHVEIGWTRAWRKDDLSERARRTMRHWGVQV